MSEQDDGNVFNLVQGGKGVPSTQEISQNEYVIVDRDGNNYFAEGFALFTSQHIAIMRDTGSGALPILIMPLDRVHIVELIDEEEVFAEDGEIVYVN